jgi:two-component system response regulator
MLNKVILLVEDNPDDEMLTVRALKKNNIVNEVVIARDGVDKEEQDLINTYNHGANSYIRKPVDFMQFTEVVRQLGLYWLVLNETAPK